MLEEMDDNTDFSNDEKLQNALSCPYIFLDTICLNKSARRLFDYDYWFRLREENRTTLKWAQRIAVEMGVVKKETDLRWRDLVTLCILGKLNKQYTMDSFYTMTKSWRGEWQRRILNYMESELDALKEETMIVANQKFYGK